MIYNKLLEEHLVNSKDKGAIIYIDKEYTYQQIHDYVTAFSKYLYSFGIKKGDRFCILTQNSIETVIAILTSISMGVVFVPVPYDIAEKRLEYVIEDCQPSIILMDRERYIKEQYGNISIILFEEVMREKEAIEYKREIVDEKETAYIIYTSGSTSNPKGVVACQKQVLFAVQAINSVIKNTKDDIILCKIPLAFDYGLYQLLMACLSEAQLILVNDKVIVQQLPKMLKEYKVTGFPVVPSLLNILVKSKLLERIELPDLRYITSTGDALPVSLIEEVEALFANVEVLPMYGLTECKRVSIMPYGNKEKKLLGSCGVALPGTKVRQINEKDGVGELEVIGPNVMSGYWNDEKETNQYFHFQGDERRLRTGDLFRVDEDGFLYFVGRMKSFIKNNGYRINVLELESMLNSVAHVIECTVVGIKNLDVGEEIVCIIYAKEGVDTEQIRKDCVETLGGINVKKFIFRSSDLPKNNNGKMDRNYMKKMIEEGLWV